MSEVSFCPAKPCRDSGAAEWYDDLHSSHSALARLSDRGRNAAPPPPPFLPLPAAASFDRACRPGAIAPPEHAA